VKAIESSHGKGFNKQPGAGTSMDTPASPIECRVGRMGGRGSRRGRDGGEGGRERARNKGRDCVERKKITISIVIAGDGSCVGVHSCGFEFNSSRSDGG
jgi:hypothetical protein